MSDPAVALARESYRLRPDSALLVQLQDLCLYGAEDGHRAVRIEMRPVSVDKLREEVRFMGTNANSPRPFHHRLRLDFSMTNCIGGRAWVVPNRWLKRDEVVVEWLPR